MVFAFKRGFLVFPPLFSTALSYPNLSIYWVLKDVKVRSYFYHCNLHSPYQSVSIRDELLFLNEETEDSLQSKIRECSNEIIGDVFIYSTILMHRSCFWSTSLDSRNLSFHWHYLIVVKRLDWNLFLLLLKSWITLIPVLFVSIMYAFIYSIAY